MLFGGREIEVDALVTLLKNLCTPTTHFQETVDCCYHYWSGTHPLPQRYASVKSHLKFVIFHRFFSLFLKKKNHDKTAVQ